MPAPTVADLKNITDTEWLEIFNMYYWHPCNADSITNQLNACVIVSWAWGSGVSGGVKLFQRNYGLSADGIAGTQTISALNRANFWDLCNIREVFYYSISGGKNSVFLKGWLNRLNDFRNTFGKYTEKKK